MLRTVLSRIYVPLLLICTLLMWGMSSVDAQQNSIGSPRTVTCTLIDTDYDIDDMMAIPLVIGNRYVAAIITTEGYTLPAAGADALSRLIEDPYQRQIPVITGASSNVSEDTIINVWKKPYILDYRKMMNKSFALLGTELHPAVPANYDFNKKLNNALAPCNSVEVLILGPFTSFVQYSRFLRAKINKVVISGVPYTGDTTQQPGDISFNCEYDIVSCRSSFYLRLWRAKYFFVDVKRTPWDKTPIGHASDVFGPTYAMVTALGEKGLPYALKRALIGIIYNGSLGGSVAGVYYWAIDGYFRAGGKSLLWDQSAAMFLLHSNLYVMVGGQGGHFQTNGITPDQFRHLWTDDTNRAATYFE